MKSAIARLLVCSLVSLPVRGAWVEMTFKGG